MENQHKHIVGYRDLTESEIAAMNQVKQVGLQVETLIGRVNALPAVNKRWSAIATTDLQKGFMSLTRAIAKPDSF